MACTRFVQAKSVSRRARARARVSSPAAGIASAIASFTRSKGRSAESPSSRATARISCCDASCGRSSPRWDDARMNAGRIPASLPSSRASRKIVVSRSSGILLHCAPHLFVGAETCDVLAFSVPTPRESFVGARRISRVPPRFMSFSRATIQSLAQSLCRFPRRTPLA